MAQSTQQVVSDGTLSTLNISFDYLDRSEITVFFNSVLTTAWTWVGSTSKTINFNSLVPNTTVVLVKRTTDITKLRHSFTGGAAFTAQTLDEDLTQTLHIAQEASEANLSGEFYADINMHNYRVTNIGTAVNDTDALSLGQYRSDSLGAATARDQAVAAAATATAAANSTIQFVLLGNWAAATVYLKNNVVYNGGNSYAALSNHTASGSFATDLAGGKWQIMAAKGTDGTIGSNGPANTLTIGTVTSGTAAATITGTAPNQVLNLVLQQGPQGIQGPQGPAGAGTGDMLKTENLSGLANYGTARTNLGLGNVDNTSDANKPVSTAQATAIGLKANTASPTFTGTVGGITAAMVGLGNVDNTSDANKPVSTAQATAIGLKANSASPTFTGTVTVPTPAAADNSTKAASTAYTTGEIATAQALNVLLAGAQTVTGAKTFSARTVHNGGAYCTPQQPTFSATPTFDCATSNVFEPAALTANVTAITMSNVQAGQTVQIRFLQDATGGRTVAVPSGAKIDGTPNTAATRVNWLVMTYSGRASRWEGNWLVVPA